MPPPLIAPKVGVSFLKKAGQFAKNLLGFGAPYLQGGAQLATQIHQNKKQREHEAKMAEYAFDRNLQMWNMQNEYNSPQAQMERYRQAGLSPDLIYGSGQASAGNAAQMPKYQAPRQNYNVKFPDLLSNIQQFQNLDIQQAQKDKLDAEREYITQKTVTESLNSQIFGLRWNRDQLYTSEFYKPQLEDEQRKRRSEILLKDAQRSQVRQQTLNMIEQAKTIKLTNEQMQITNKWKAAGLEGEDILYKLIFMHMENSSMDWKNVALGVRAGQEVLSMLQNFGLAGILKNLTGKGKLTGSKSAKKSSGRTISERVQSDSKGKVTGRTRTVTRRVE